MAPNPTTPAPVSPLTARKTWRTVEPLHGMIYFAPEASASYARLGIRQEAGYFASRSAPMGAVGAETVIATFYNFNPRLVRTAVTDGPVKNAAAATTKPRTRSVRSASLMKRTNVSNMAAAASLGNTLLGTLFR